MDDNKKRKFRVTSPLSLLGGAAMLLMIALTAAGIHFQADTDKAAPKLETVNLRMALVDSSTAPASVGAAEFAERVREQSKNRINIELFCNGRLVPDENSIVEQVRIGGIDLACVPVSAMESIAPSLDLLQLPYLITDSDHLRRVLESELGEKMLHESDSKRVLGLVFYDEGPRVYCNSLHPVSWVSDFRELRLGVPKNPLYKTVCELLSAQAEQLAQGDIYRSLKTGRINGLDDNLIGYVMNNHYSMAKYVTLSYHAMPPSIVIASADVFDSLSAEDAALIYDCARKSVEVQRLSCRRLTESAFAFLESGACEVSDGIWIRSVLSGMTKEMYGSYGGYTEEIAYIESLKTES